MSREEILNKISRLELDNDETQKDRFSQLFENDDNLMENIESIITTDWTLYRYFPEELQNNSEIIALVEDAINRLDDVEDEQIDLNDLNIVEKIQLSIDESRKQQEHIDSLIEEMRNETRTVIIDELREEIDRLTQAHKDYDEMTNDDYNRIYNHLNEIINRLVVENSKNPLNDKKKNMFNNALERRNSLLDIARKNGDILFVKEVNDIEEKIEEFKEEYNRMINHIDKIRKSLVLGIDTESLNINNEIIELQNELKELTENAEKLISDLDEFKQNALGETTSMSVRDIKHALSDLQYRLYELKKSQVNKYNSRVSAMNAKINELKALTDVPENIANLIEQLVPMNLCDVTSYKDVKYLDNIKYDLLVKNYNILGQINGIKYVEKNALDDDISYIQNEIKRIDYYITDTMTSESVALLNKDILDTASYINDFRVKLEENKDKLPENEYEDFLSKVKTAENDLYKLNEKLKKVKDVDKENKLYQELLTRLNNLSRYVSSLEILVEVLKGNVHENTIDVFKSKFDGTRRSLSQIKEEIEQAKSEGKLDNVQYNNLNAKINEIEEAINRANDKLLDPEMVMGGDTFTLINGNIDRLEEEIEKLENRINTLDQPIKDRKVRKDIDKTIANLERDIKVIRSILKKHKDEDEEKYRASVERLNGLEERLSKISKNYRSKCPLRVKSVKSAKAFYKKHKKPILIAAGIAALAVELTVGPVIMPAIIKGNLMLMNKLPFTRSILFKINNILSGFIGAKEVGGILKLASGTILNPQCVSASLLKGVALSGVGTATLISPLIISIKALWEKMKKTKLKDEIKKSNSNVKINNTDLDKLYDEYKKFGGTAEEFAEFYGLDQQFVEILNNLDNERSNGERQPEETNDNGRSRQW